MTARRILLINHEYPPLGGGAGTATRHLAKGLARLGQQVFVLTSAWPGLPEREEADGVVVQRVGAGRSDLRKISTAEGTRFAIAAMFAARKLAAHWKIDAVLAFFTMPGAAVGLFLKRTR